MTLTLTDHLGAAGTEGDWELLDSVSPVMTEGARKWIRDLARPVRGGGHPGVVRVLDGGLQSSGRDARQVPATRAAWSRQAQDVFLDVPSHQMHFGTRVRNYLRQMYKECADEIAAAGLPVVLQFGETQWWYFDNQRAGPATAGCRFYDQDTISAFAAAKGHQIWPFTANTDDPAGDPAHPKETADFLRDRIWAYCQDVIAYVRSYHPTAVFECLWPLDANQGKPAPEPTYRRLLMHVNLPNQWKTSSYGIKYFRCEGFDYDVWQKNATLMRRPSRTRTRRLGGPPRSACTWRACTVLRTRRSRRRTACGSRRSSTPCASGRSISSASTAGRSRWTHGRKRQRRRRSYHKPRAARAVEVATAVEVASPAGGAMNRFKLNERKLNG